MSIAPAPENEAERLGVVRSLLLFDTPPEAAYDDLVALAARICEAPMAVVALVDDEREWFKARLGVPLAEAPRAQSFSGHVILGGEALVVSDASVDERFREHPLLGPPVGVRFCAATPLVTNDGYAVGALAVLDRRPRSLDEGQLAALRGIGRQVTAQLESRRMALQLGRQIKERQHQETLIRLANEDLSAYAEVLRSQSELLELSLDAIVIRDMAQRVTFWSRGAEQIYGELRSDVLCMPSPTLARACFPEPLEQIEARLINFGSWEGEVLYLRADGRAVAVESRWALQRDADGRPIAVLEISRDVTEARRIAAERARFAALLEATPDIVAVADAATGRPLYLNRACRELLGAGGALAHDSPAEQRALEGLLPGSSFERRDDPRFAAAARDGVWCGEMTMRRRDGDELPLSQVLLYQDEADGKGGFFATIGRDLSERLALERRKNEFLSVASHELRTPLTSIRGSLGLIEGRVLGEVTPDVLDHVRIARENTDRLIRLINDLLDLEKMDAQRAPMRRERVHVAGLVQSTLAFLRGMASEASVALRSAVDPGTAVAGDFDRLVQVLTNLASNAIHFSPVGGAVDVSVAAMPGGRVRFAVSDQGPGIPEAQLPRLFNKFEQLARRGPGGGTGLGLAISKALVEQHGGVIGVDTQPGRGSTFWFELPQVA